MSLYLRVVLLLEFRKPPIISLGSPQHFVFESSVNIGCFSKPPTIVGMMNPHHFFREPQTFLQLRVVLLLDSRKPPSFLQGAPNNLYLRVASILDVLGSPRHFSSFTRVKRFVCWETPTIVGKGRPHHFFREPPMFLYLRVVLLLELRKPTPHHFFGEPPTFCI